MQKVSLTFVREVKHSVLYQNKAAGWQGVYIPKTTMAKLGAPAYPETLEMTLEVK